MDMVHIIVDNGYKARPEVYPSNLIIQTGDKTGEKLISEVDKGILTESMGGFARDLRFG